MLGLLLVYWIGKRFYILALKHKRSKWGFAILGISVYYGTMLFFSFMTGIISEIVSPGYFETYNEYFFSFIMLILGLLSCFLFFKYLEKRWNKITPNPLDLIDDFGKDDESIFPKE